MENRYNTYVRRHEIRQALLAAEHGRRIFDFSGNTARELDSYRATILELLGELDDAAERLQKFQASYDAEQSRRNFCERELTRLKKENALLGDSMAAFHKNTPSDTPLSANDSLEDLPLAARVKNLLSTARFSTVRDLFAFNTHDFMNIPGFGVNALTDVNHALFRRGLPPLSETTPATPYVYTGERPLHDVDEPVEALKLHPHVEFLMKGLGKYTVRSVLLTTANEKRKVFDYRGQALRYLWDVLALISFPARPIPGGVVSEYGNNELFSRAPRYLRLSTYTVNVLTEKDILTIGDLLVHSRESLRRMTGFTFNTIDPIQKKLKKYNLRLRRRGKELMPSRFERPSGITSDLMNETML